MNAISIVIIVALAGAVVWLTIDTIIYIVKKVKLKKKEKQVSQNATDDK